MKNILIALLLILPLVASSNDRYKITKADSLCKVAITLAEKKNFDAAIKHYTSSDSIYKKLLPASDTLRLKATKELVDCYTNYSRNENDKGNNSRAMQLVEKALAIQSSHFGKENEKYTDILNRKAMTYFTVQKYKEAIATEIEAINICKRIFGEKDQRTAAHLYFIAHFYSTAGDNESAIKYGEAAIAAYRADAKSDKLNYAFALNNLALCYNTKGLPQQALELLEEAQPIFKEKLGTDNANYPKMLNNIAMLYNNAGQHKEAILLGEETVAITKKILGTNNATYLKYFNDLAVFYADADEIKKAFEMQKELVNASKIIHGDCSAEYLGYLNNFAMSYYKMGDYLKASELSAECVAKIIDIKNYNILDYALYLSRLSMCSGKLGMFTEALESCTEALNLYKKHVGEEHPLYLAQLTSMASLYDTQDRHSEALELTRRIVTIRKKVLGDKHPKYIESLNNLAYYYTKIGNIDEAARIMEFAVGKAKEALDKKDDYYTTTLSNWADILSINEEWNKAIELCKEIIAIRKQTLGEKHPDYAFSLNNLATYYYKNNDIKNALEYYIQALEIFAETSPIGYIGTLQNLADCLFKIGEKEEAIKYTIETLEEKEEIYGKQSLEYTESLHRLSSYYLGNEKNELATAPFLEQLQTRSNIVRNNFSNLTAKERESYWHQHKYVYEDDTPFIAYYTNNQQLINAAYDATLLSKGVLLDTELEMKTLLKESGDKAAIKLYEELRKSRILLSKMYETPKENRIYNTDSLERIAVKQEQELVKASKVYGDYTRNMAITWKDVQKNLKEGDIAIEFSHFASEQEKDIIYTAFTLKKGDVAPKMKTIFKKKQLDETDADDWYYTPQLAEIIWGALADELQGVNNIYFAPTGELHSIAIETLPMDSTLNMSDKYNLYRLTSTRQLAIGQEKRATENVALYGGLLYDADTLALANENRKYEVALRQNREITQTKTAIKRNAATYLPATLHEVEKINNMFAKNNKIKASTYTGIKGTEESLKSLSGKGTNILHIATHGFYWSDEEALWMRNAGFLQQADSRRATDEDKALVRSGLLFSGANHTLNGALPTSMTDDGVLTAKELANIDLRELELAVLSACQSGLGDVTGEGVFGMQRGFKKAGAKSILMSLWKVDDTATAMLMSEFYNNLTNGKSAYESLRTAQQYVRTYESEEEIKDESGETTKRRIRKFEDPFYWAAFVLLDAI